MSDAIDDAVRSALKNSFAPVSSLRPKARPESLTDGSTKSLTETFTYTAQDNNLTGEWTPISERYALVAPNGIETIANTMQELSKLQEEIGTDEAFNRTEREGSDDERYIDRMTDTHETMTELYIYATVHSNLPPEYWLGSAMRESWLDKTNYDPKNGTYGALQIKEDYFKDAVQWVENPNGMFDDYLAIAKDPNIPMDMKLRTTEDTMWAAALKEAYLTHYMEAYDLPSDTRSFYLLHLGAGNARNIADALKNEPENTVDNIFSKQAFKNKHNNALMKTDKGEPKTAQQFWDDLEKLGIPSGEIPKDPDWRIDNIEIIVTERLSYNTLDAVASLAPPSQSM